MKLPDDKQYYYEFNAIGTDQKEFNSSRYEFPKIGNTIFLHQNDFWI